MLITHDRGINPPSLGYVWGYMGHYWPWIWQFVIFCDGWTVLCRWFLGCCREFILFGEIYGFFQIFQGSQQNSGLWNPWLPGWMIDCRLLICLPDICLIFVGNDFCMSMLLGPKYIYIICDFSGLSMFHFQGEITNSFIATVSETLQFGRVVQCGAPSIAKLAYNSNKYGLWYL